MTQSVIDVPRHRGQFFEILQETAQSQTAVMTIGVPGRTGGRRRLTPATRSCT
jgi:hypothetical protein